MAMRKTGVIVFKAALLLVLWFVLISLGWRVHAIDASAYRPRIGPDVDAQLASIQTRLHADGPLPWRPMFSHTFYGYSLVNLVLLDPENEARRTLAIQELEWILERLEIPEIAGRYTDTQVPHGVYYLGERALTLAALMLVDHTPNPAYEAEFHQTTQTLYDSFLASPSAHIETAPGNTWPADNVPAFYALALHDRLYGSDYSLTTKRWVEHMETHLDSETGLMPAKIDYYTGEVLNVPRGVGLSFTFIFLPELDPDFAASQYARFQEVFFESTLGFAGIREYPPGISRESDVDSGPIIFGVGAGASGLGLVAARAMGDDATFKSLLQLAEIIGFPNSWNGQRQYLFGQLLLADEIILWSKTYTPWLSSASSPAAATSPPSISFTLFYFDGIAVTVAVVLLIFSTRVVRAIRSNQGGKSREC